MIHDKSKLGEEKTSMNQQPAKGETFMHLPSDMRGTCESICATCGPIHCFDDLHVSAAQLQTKNGLLTPSALTTDKARRASGC